MSDWGKFTDWAEHLIPKDTWRAIRAAIDAIAVSHGIPLPQLRAAVRRYTQRNPDASEEEILDYARGLQATDQEVVGNPVNPQLIIGAIAVIGGAYLWLKNKR